MIAKTRHPLVGDFMASLEEEGHRLTEARHSVSMAVAAQGGHFTAEALCGQLPGVGRATVYRTIKLMVDLGFVCRVLLSDGSLHYQVSHRGHHHHLICTECGRSKDLLGCDIERVLLSKAAEQGFAAQGHWLEVYGRCSQCDGVGAS